MTHNEYQLVENYENGLLTEQEMDRLNPTGEWKEIYKVRQEAKKVISLMDHQKEVVSFLGGTQWTNN